MRLLLVRHGQTSSNLGRLLDTNDPGADLTPLGRTQAEALVDSLGAQPIDAVYASTLVRTQQTAAPLGDWLGLPVTVREGLREVRAGDLEMMGDDASVSTYMRTVLAWADGELGIRMPGAETGSEVFARFDGVIDEVADSGVPTAVLVSHGAVIRSWSAYRVANVSTDYVARNPVRNTGAVVLEGSPRRGWHALTWQGDALGDPLMVAL